MTVPRRPRHEWVLLRAVQLGASFVPASARADWQLEWESELVYRFQQRHVLPVTACVSLCYGIARDAIGLRLGGLDEWRHNLSGGWRALDTHRLSACGTMVVASIIVAPLVPLALVSQVLIALLARSGRPNALLLIGLVAVIGVSCLTAMLSVGARAVRAVCAPLAESSPTARVMALASSAVFSASLAVLGLERLAGVVEPLGQAAPRGAALAVVLMTVLGALVCRRSS